MRVYRFRDEDEERIVEAMNVTQAIIVWRSHVQDSWTEDGTPMGDFTDYEPVSVECISEDAVLRANPSGQTKGQPTLEGEHD